MRNEQHKAKSRQLTQLLTLMMAGKSQKFCADKLGVTEKTIGTWLKEAPAIKEKIKAYRKGEIDNPFKLDDSLNGYLAMLRISNDQLYRASLPAVTKYQNKISKM